MKKDVNPALLGSSETFETSSGRTATENGTTSMAGSNCFTGKRGVKGLARAEETSNWDSKAEGGALRNIINKLSDERNSKDLHVKHYLTSTAQFKKRTTHWARFNETRAADIHTNQAGSCPTVATKSYKQQEVFLATTSFVFGRSRTPNPWRKTLLRPGTGRFGWFRCGLYRKSTIANGLSCVENQKWIFRHLLRPFKSIPVSRALMVPTEWQVQTILGDCISKAKVITVQALQYRQHALISDFLDFVNLSVQEGALATNWSMIDLKG